MWQQEFTWFFTLFHQELRKNDPIAFEVLMVLALAHLFGFYNPKPHVAARIYLVFYAFSSGASKKRSDRLRGTHGFSTGSLVRVL